MLAQLAEPFKCSAPARGTFLQDTPAVVCQRHPRWDDGGAARAGRDPRRAVAGEARDAVDTRGLNRLGEGHRRQDGGEPPCQHRLARPRGAEQEQIMVRTPASTLASLYHPGVPIVIAVDLDLE